MIRVVLPAHLRTLTGSGHRDVELEIPGDVTGVTIDAVLTALEAKYPMLNGTIRERATKARRPFVRFFVCGEDWSFADAGASLPEAVAEGAEPFLVVGAVAGGALPRTVA